MRAQQGSTFKGGAECRFSRPGPGGSPSVPPPDAEMLGSGPGVGVPESRGNVGMARAPREAQRPWSLTPKYCLHSYVAGAARTVCLF